MSGYNHFVTFPSRPVSTHLYFITATISGWKPLFSEPVYASIVLNSLAWLTSKGRCSLFAFVLMPSHLHAVLKPHGQTIGDLLQDFGSFTGHQILAELRAAHRQEWLEFFHRQRRDKRHSYSIWQDIQAKNIYSMKFLYRKIEYIHNNPVKEGAKLVADRSDYRYSSACFYDCGCSPIIAVTDIREFLLADPPIAEGTAAADGG